MTLPSTRELRLLRQEHDKWLSDVATHRRRIYDGDNDMEPMVINPEVACRFKPGYGHWMPLADKYQNINPFTITFAFGYDIVDSDQIIDVNGGLYEVRDVKAPASISAATVVLADKVV